jgi:hypothetical protein
MKSLADGLPPAIAAQINPAWRKNEADYWIARSRLLAQYGDQWIAFADGKVIASAKSPAEVVHAAHRLGGHPFVTCVARENEPIRMRRASFAYDAAYPGEALPVIDVEFRSVSGAAGQLLARVIPDTGADASALPWSDCQLLNLDPTQGVPALMGGVGGSAAATVAFPAWVWFDG